MPVIDAHSRPPVTEAQMKGWQPLHRIEDTGGNITVVSTAIQNYPFQRLVYAEGDSWFDKFTPLGANATNLLHALRLPVFAGVVDVSHIGDTAANMVSSWQRRQTAAMFNLFDFDAILLSAGGNDLKNLFATLYDDLGNRNNGQLTLSDATLLEPLAAGRPDSGTFFDGVIEKINAFIAMRDAAKRAKTRGAPLILHGYDYLQPRPAPAKILSGTSLGSGPWIHPALEHAGLDDAQMLAAATKVIDELNTRLCGIVAARAVDNVYVLDQRGTLELAAPNTRTDSGDWQDEIHPTPEGFTKLGTRYWNPWLAKLTNLA